MNFFEAQDKARRFTKWLVVIYILSTILIVAGVTLVVGAALNAFGQDAGGVNLQFLGAIAIFSTLFILGASLFKTARLSAGGGRVALDMGGTLVSSDAQDPLRRRLRNVVEEMAIASGVPVPETYVLEEESGINAFAAGFAPGDAAIAVTRGTLELLDRDELQGVIAHEFSHILNGDMRLNIRMMGVLFGIMVLGIIGRLVLRSSRHNTLVSNRRGRTAPAVLIIGLGLTILGSVGVLMARIVKAAVSRQREFLADASAVQFTRQSDGIANALKKIGGYSQQSYIRTVDPEEISHMLFAGGVARMTSLLATHPPLAERIKALDPAFRDSEYPTVDPQRHNVPRFTDQASGFAASTVDDTNIASAAAITDNIADAVGHPEPRHVDFARRLRRSIPETLYDAAHAPDEAFLLALALALADDHSEQQLHVIESQLGATRAALVQRYHEQVRDIGAMYRLPLLEIAFPMLKSRPIPQLEYLLKIVRRIIQVDGRIDLREFCYYRILSSHLSQATDPAASSKKLRVSRKAAQSAAVELIRIIADQGNHDKASRDNAFQAGITVFGRWAGDYKGTVDGAQTVTTLEQNLNILRRMNSRGRQSLLQAVSQTISFDNKLTIAEAELLRAICASLDCPLPPILTDRHPTLESSS